MRSTTDVVAKFRQLTGQERWLLAQAWLLLLLSDLALRVFPFRTILHDCRRQQKPQGQQPVDLSVPALRIAWLVEKAGQYCPLGTSCLKEALVLSRLLARRGVPTQLRIGVGRQAEAFAAHAWLEQDGRVILGDRNIEEYAPLL